MSGFFLQGLDFDYDFFSKVRGVLPLMWLDVPLDNVKAPPGAVKCRVVDAGVPKQGL